jgi:hypothetical protein
VAAALGVVGQLAFDLLQQLGVVPVIIKTADDAVALGLQGFDGVFAAGGGELIPKTPSPASPPRSRRMASR